MTAMPACMVAMNERLVFNFLYLTVSTFVRIMFKMRQISMLGKHYADRT